MTATEEICRLLDECGVKWTDHGYENHIWWKGFDGVRWHAENRHCVDGWCVKVEAVLTPEQAIAATLGRGMLTADDVRDLIERHSDASGGNGRDFHNGAYVAIADELIATLEPGECRFKTVERFIDARRSRADMCECDRCGYRCARGFIQDERFKYCPNCGRKVVSE